MANSTHSEKPKERHIILDALRGLALFGICLANFPEFSLYTFLPERVTAAMPTAGIDTIIKYLQYIFIDGKFYTIFSLLFGIGFSIILSNAARNNRNGIKIFYRRMSILLLIGLFHLICLWAGDILILYAFMGFFLPFFRNVPDKKLLLYSVLLLLFPIAIDASVELLNLNPAAPAIAATQYFHGQFGITEENFPVWLAESQNYLDILKFNIAGSFIRLQEFIEGNRAFKVLGLFLLGLYIGRKGMYAKLQENKNLLRKVRTLGFILGFPTSLIYAWSAMNAKPFGLTFHSFVYAVSVVPLSFAYISLICLWYIQNKERKIFRIFAAPGRMALTNYLMQSVFGMIIFYGIGFELGAKTGLIYVELIAGAVFGIQIIYSYIWLHYNRFGPLEWGWRMLTYGNRLKLKR
jgi:Predicted membrane protein